MLMDSCLSKIGEYQNLNITADGSDMKNKSSAGAVCLWVCSSQTFVIYSQELTATLWHPVRGVCREQLSTLGSHIANMPFKPTD